MAAKQTLASLLAAYLLLLAPLVAALQVSAGSPCSSFCLDTSDLDASDPESSNTLPEDITCHDGDFASHSKGQRFQRCLTCLQDSDYAKGHETDQQWFFYNLRYAFDYCVFGFPNATDVESSPCVTSEACGRIEDALKDGIVEPAHAEPYGYCAVDNSIMTSGAVDNCLSCVRAGSNLEYVSNFLTAIQAGCEQQPPAGITVGLSGSVFTDGPIDIVLPISESDSDSRSSLSTPAIVGISLGAVVVVLLAAGCAYMQIRRRRNRAARAARRASPLSFRCQTHLTPMTATFPEGSGGEQEKAFVDLSAAALGSNPVSSWQSHDNMRSHAGLHSITTSIPKPPAPAVAIPHMTSPRIQSPDDYFQTPTSTTSNAPLLASFRPYVPSDYNAGGQLIPGVAVSIPQETSSPSFSPRQPQQQQRSPRIGGTSPRVEQRGWYDRPSQPAWTPQNPTEGATRDLAKGKRAISGSPVSASTIQTSFPPPPMR